MNIVANTLTSWTDTALMAPSRLVTTQEIEAEFGVPAAKIRRLHRDRDKTGFPAAKKSKGRTQWWAHSDVKEFLAASPANQRLQLIARQANQDPDILLNAAQSSRFLGYKNANQVTVFRRERPGYFPEPDESVVMGTPEHPRRRQRWRIGTLIAWAESRPGPGRHKDSERDMPALPYVAWDGDPDEPLTGPQAAFLLEFKNETSFRRSRSAGNLPLLDDHSMVLVLNEAGREVQAWPRRLVQEQDAARRVE